MRKLLIYGSMEELFLTDVLKYTQITCLETKGERDTIKNNNKVDEVYLRFDLWMTNCMDIR
jgi:hypothetical protein